MNPSNKSKLESVVDTIIAKKQSGQDTTQEEQQIDLMVYELYELTYEEDLVVDPETPINREEYEAYKSDVLK